LKNTKISIFGGISKFHLQVNFGKFWQFGAVLGISGRFAAFTMAEIMPELGLKSSKPHSFSTVSPNVTCNGSLENYSSISIASKSFKKSKNLLHSWKPTQTRKNPFWLTKIFRG
jgi:hypothetical protein